VIESHRFDVRAQWLQWLTGGIKEAGCSSHLIGEGCRPEPQGQRAGHTRQRQCGRGSQYAGGERSQREKGVNTKVGTAQGVALFLGDGTAAGWAAGKGDGFDWDAVIEEHNPRDVQCV
jgi:hypothetical protein